MIQTKLFPIYKRILVALAEPSKVTLSLTDDRAAEWRRNVYGDCKADPKPAIKDYAKSTIDYELKRHSPYADRLIVEHCPASACLEFIDKAARLGKPYDAVITENPYPSQYLSPRALAAPIHAISPKTFVIHYDRNPENPIRRYTYVPKDSASHSYSLLKTEDLRKLSHQNSLIARLANPTMHHLKDPSKAVTERILYIGPQDPLYRSKVERTIQSAEPEANKIIRMDSTTSYDLAAIKENYQQIIIEENSWNPNTLELAKEIKAAFPKATIYIFPTNKDTRDSRVQEIDSANIPGVKALRFSNLAIRGKMAGEKLFESVKDSSELKEVLKETKKEMSKRDPDYQGKDPKDIIDEEALANNYLAGNIYKIYAPRFYMVLAEDEYESFGISDLLSCFCSEIYASKIANGGGIGTITDPQKIEEDLLKVIDKGIYPEAIFINHRYYEKHYQEIVEVVNKISPHIKVIVVTGFFNLEDLEQASHRQLKDELIAEHTGMKVTNYLFRRLFGNKAAIQLRQQDIPALSGEELLHSPGKIAHEKERGKIYPGPTSDQLLNRYLDYN